MKPSYPLLVFLLALSPILLISQSIEGVWQLTKVEVETTDDKISYDSQPGLLLIQNGYYSMAMVMSREKRPLFSKENPQWKDIDQMKKANSYASNAGTYTISGNRFEAKHMVAKYPNNMEEEGPYYMYTEEVTLEMPHSSTFELKDNYLYLTGELKNEDGSLAQKRTTIWKRLN